MGTSLIVKTDYGITPLLYKSESISFTYGIVHSPSSLVEQNSIKSIDNVQFPILFTCCAVNTLSLPLKVVPTSNINSGEKSIKSIDNVQLSHTVYLSCLCC